MPDSNKGIMSNGVASIMPNGLWPNFISKKACHNNEPTWHPGQPCIPSSPFLMLSSDGRIQEACLDVSPELPIAAPPFHSILFGMPCRSIGICAVGCQDLPCHTNTSCSSCHQSKRWVCLHSWHHPLQSNNRYYHHQANNIAHPNKSFEASLFLSSNNTFKDSIHCLVVIAIQHAPGKVSVRVLLLLCWETRLQVREVRLHNPCTGMFPERPLEVQCWKQEWVTSIACETCILCCLVHVCMSPMHMLLDLLIHDISGQHIRNILLDKMKGSPCSLTTAPAEFEFKLGLRIKAMINNGFNITGKTIGLLESLSLIIDPLSCIIHQSFHCKTIIIIILWNDRITRAIWSQLHQQVAGVNAARGELWNMNSSKSCWKALDKSFLLRPNRAGSLTRSNSS